MTVQSIAAICGIASGFAGLIASFLLLSASRQSSDTQAAKDGLKLLEMSLSKPSGTAADGGIDTAQVHKDLLQTMLDERIAAKEKERLAARIFIFAFLAILAQSVLLYFTVTAYSPPAS
jgi:hypothetical protein